MSQQIARVTPNDVVSEQEVLLFVSSFLVVASASDLCNILTKKICTFQGQSAGPVNKGQPQNAVNCITYEPGTNQFEGSNPGLLYMGVSRATTAGTGELNSAVYFTGTNMNRHRVLNLTKKRDGYTMYKKVELRKAWVERLDENTINLEFTDTERNELSEWARTFRMTTEELEECLSKTLWRTNLKKTNI